MADKKNTKTKSTAAKKSSSAKKSPGRRTAPAKPEVAPIPRWVWAAGFCLMGFVGLLSILEVGGYATLWFRWLCGSLVGYGYYLMPFAFILAGILLLRHLQGKARLRAGCFFLLPLVWGALLHLCRNHYGYRFTFDGLALLASHSRLPKAGGILGGWLAIGLRALISDVGGVILCVILLLVCLWAGFNIDLESLRERFRLLPEPEEEELPRKPAKPSPAPAGPTQRAESLSRAAKKRPSAIDLPVDDGPLVPEEQPEPESLPFPDPTAPPKPSFTTREANLDKQPREGGLLSRLSRLKKDKPEEETLPAEAPAETEAEQPVFPDIGTGAPAHPDFTDEPVYTEPEYDEPPFDAEPVGEDMMEVPAEVLATIDQIAPKKEKIDMNDPTVIETQEQLSMAIADGELPETYIYPPITLLTPGTAASGDHEAEKKRRSEQLLDTLKSFGVEARCVGIVRGPTVTRYELQLQRGTKFSRITNLADDIALSLGASGIRIAPIPEKNAIGIEVPNDAQQTIRLRELLESPQFKNAKSKVSFAVGRDISNQCVVGDIAKMPHMLIAGTTGSGKSVCINSLLISLIYKATPEEVRLIMVDPKMIELGVYNGLPHLLIPVVTDPKKAAGALNWAVGEMMRRYKLLSEKNVRNLADYNEVARKENFPTLPQIVIVIDELADLMFVAAKEVEEAIARIAQMARAAGMHLVIATQRPSADVITGIMKANIPSRIAFAVASQIESRIILDQMGAEKLVGRGDMLYGPLGEGKPRRVQGCFVTSEEVESVVGFIKKTSQADYSQEIMDSIERAAAQAESGGDEPDEDGDGEDPMLDDAISVAVENGQISVSMLQRKLKLGYSRAARLVDIMEARGIVGPFEGSRPREVRITRDQWKEMQLRKQDL